MEQKKQSKLSNSVIFGLLSGFTLIIFSVVLFITGKYGSGVQYFGYLFLAAGIVVGTLNYRDKINGGYIDFGGSVGSGVLISLFTSILLAIFVPIYMKYFNPGFVDEMMAKIQEEWKGIGFWQLGFGI